MNTWQVDDAKYRNGGGGRDELDEDWVLERWQNMKVVCGCNMYATGLSFLPLWSSLTLKDMTVFVLLFQIKSKDSANLQ